MAKKKLLLPKEVGCEFCPLNDGENIIVESTRGPDYRAGGLMFVGEAPGKTEDDDGKPFVGVVGQFMRDIWREIGIDSDTVYIANASKCHPFDKNGKTREPSAEELHCCSVYLHKEILKAKPRVIVALGNAACKSLIFRTKISNLRGHVFRYRDLPIYVVPAVHPSGVRRQMNFNETALDQFKEDLLTAVKLIEITVPENPKVQIAQNSDEALEMLEEIFTWREVAIDVEGHLSDLAVFCIGFSNGRETYVIPISHPENRLGDKSKRVREAIRKILINRYIKKIGQNFNEFDRDSLQKYFKCRIRGFDWDTQQGSSLRDERLGVHDLSMIAGRVLRMGGYDWRLEKIREEMGFADDDDGRKKFMSQLENVSLAILGEYCGLDAYVTYRAAKKQQKLLTEQQQKLCRAMSAAIEPYHSMEKNGFYFDVAYSQKIHVEYQKKIEKVERKIRLEAGQPDLNLNSHPQIGELLFEKLKLQRKLPRSIINELDIFTEKGAYSTRDEVLQTLAENLPKSIAADIQDHRDWSKSDGTFIVGMQKRVNPKDSRIHEKVWLPGTVTGRGASVLHNVKKDFEEYTDPKTKELLRKYPLLDQFRAAPGYRLFKADNSQAEMRIMAEMSEDPELLGIYQRDEDFHHFTTNFIFDLGCKYCRKGIPHPPKYKLETDDERTIGKNTNFGTAFGLDEIQLYYYLKKKIVGFSRTEAEVREFWHKFYEKFKVLRKWQKRIIRFAKEYGYVEGLFGRIRHFDFTGSPSFIKHTENQCINAPIQGSAHDVLVVQINGTWEVIRNTPVRLLLDQHDAALFEIPEKGWDRYIADIKDAMSNPDIEGQLGRKLIVPWKCDFKEGETWGEMI
jgi:DNA polymerase I